MQLIDGIQQNHHIVEDGLSSLAYTVISAEYNLLYNNITVDIGKPDWKVDERPKVERTTSAQEHLIAHGSLYSPSKLVSACITMDRY